MIRLTTTFKDSITEEKQSDSLSFITISYNEEAWWSTRLGLENAWGIVGYILLITIFHRATQIAKMIRAGVGIAKQVANF